MHMKKVLFILFSFLVLAGSVNAQFVSGNTQIMLMQKDGDRDPPGQIGDTSPENAPQTRGVILQPVCASLYNKVVTVDFQTAFSAATVNVINETTGETVYSEACLNPLSLFIDLNNQISGEYFIEIILSEISLQGEFTL